jgi:glycosyltransferase involved in cell wall biosynthesis
MLTRDYPPKIGGIATHTSALVKHLKKIGVQVDVFAGTSDIRTLFKPIRQSFNEYDIVHVQSSPYGAFVRKQPMVVTVHAPVRTEAEFYTWSLKLKSIPAYILEKFTFRKCESVIAVSELTKKDLIEKYGLASSKIDVILNGVEYEKFRTERSIAVKNGNVAQSGVPSILILSRLEPRKNIEEAILVLSKIRKRFKVTIAGEGSERHKLEKLSKEKNVNIDFLGRVDAERLPGVYAHADIFVSTSRSEGFGLTILEAMASGCAVVASKIPTHRDLIENGRNGILYENTLDFEAKLNLLLSDSDLVRKIGREAQDSAEKFSWDNVASQVLKQYTKCLNLNRN